MPGKRHAKPSATAKAGKAASPAAAAVGTLVTMNPRLSKPPVSPASPASPVSKTKRLRADALIRHTGQQTYTVQPGDTLISIASASAATRGSGIREGLPTRSISARHRPQQAPSEPENGGSGG